MKYAVMQCSNGNFSIAGEWTDLQMAIVNFHSVCTTLWNSPDVKNATVQVVDEKFTPQKTEYIKY